MEQHRENNVSAAIIFGIVVAIVTIAIFFLTGASTVSTIAFRVTITILALTSLVLTLTYITSLILVIRRCHSIYLCFFDRGSGIALFTFFIFIISPFILLITSTSTTSTIVLRVFISAIIGLFSALMYCFTTLIACFINNTAHNI